jgi:hypothetical protein
MVLQVPAHPGAVRHVGIPAARSTSPGPMPESWRRCGELIAPPASTISRRAWTMRAHAPAGTLDPGGAAIGDDDPAASVAVQTVRLGRFIAGRRKAVALLSRARRGC